MDLVPGLSFEVLAALVVPVDSEALDIVAVCIAIGDDSFGCCRTGVGKLFEEFDSEGLSMHIGVALFPKVVEE